jgi:hypothetical protein
MDAIVDLVRGSPVTTVQQSSALQAKLQDALSKGGKKLTPQIDRVLTEGILSPQQGHGLACAEMLAFRAVHGGPLTGEFVEQARTVLAGLAARDIPLVAKAVTNISRQLTKLLLANNATIRGLGAVKAVIATITGASRSVSYLSAATRGFISLKGCALMFAGD